MKINKTPFCKECKYYGGKTICLEASIEGKRFDHIKPNFWCGKGQIKMPHTAVTVWSVRKINLIKL